MVQLVMKDIAGKIETMPLVGVQFREETSFGDPTDDNIIIYNLEKESSVKMNAVGRKTGQGSKIQLGYMLDATLYIPYNTSTWMGQLPDIILGTANNKAYTTVFLFGNASGYTSPTVEAPEVINSTNGLMMHINCRRLRYLKEYESIEYRPRTILKITGFIKEGELAWY